MAGGFRCGATVDSSNVAVGGGSRTTPRMRGAASSSASQAAERKARPVALLRQRHRELAIHTAGLRLFQGPRQERVTLHELLQALEKDLDARRRSLPQDEVSPEAGPGVLRRDTRACRHPGPPPRYVRARQEAGAAPATINRQLEFIQRAFALAVEAGTLTMRPGCLASPEKCSPRVLERAELEAVLTHLADPDVRDFVDWFAWTGMRPGEIRALTWAAFDRETWTLRLHAKDAKTGHGRVLALEGPLRTIVERRVTSRRIDSPLIFHRRGRLVGDIRKQWKKACKAAGAWQEGWSTIFDGRPSATSSVPALTRRWP